MYAQTGGRAEEEMKEFYNDHKRAPRCTKSKEINVISEEWNFKLR